MANIESQVLTTVNAPYGANLSSHQLGLLLMDPESVGKINAAVFAFFSEVPIGVQKQFIKNMGLNLNHVTKVAKQFAKMSGYELPLAA